MKKFRQRSLLTRAVSLIGSLGLFVAIGTVVATSASAAKLPANTSGDPRATYTAGNIHDGDCGKGTDITKSVNYQVDASNTYITLVAPFPTQPFQVIIK